MADKVKSFKELFNSNEDYADILDMFDEENMFNEDDIARDTKMDVDTVKNIKKSWVDEDTSYLSSVFSINKKQLKKTRH